MPRTRTSLSWRWLFTCRFISVRRISPHRADMLRSAFDMQRSHWGLRRAALSRMAEPVPRRMIPRYVASVRRRRVEAIPPDPQPIVEWQERNSMKLRFSGWACARPPVTTGRLRIVREEPLPAWR